MATQTTCDACDRVHISQATAEWVRLKAYKFKPLHPECGPLKTWDLCPACYERAVRMLDTRDTPEEKRP